MARKRMTKASACETVAKDLRAWGYPDVTGAMIREVLDAWLDGKRDQALPHGIVGMFASRQFDDADRVRPGTLKALPD
jgi:hypothetical protein